MTSPLFRTSLIAVATVLLFVGGCADSSRSDRSAAPAITDTDYLTADLWNDGQAEVAFYRVERTVDPYGDRADQAFLVGSYLVKHRFSPEKMTKMTDGTGTSSFKYALFYEFETGSYQHKYSWVVNARQRDLRPFKHSFTSFDWCSNRYSELAYPPEGDVEIRMRSDDYGNRRGSFATQPHSYPPAQIPLLVRGLDFADTERRSFSVTVAADSAHVGARATLLERDTVNTEAGRIAAQRIRVTYDEPVPSPIGEESDTTEIYWRGTGPERLLVQVRAASGRYQMSLVEHLRSPYWKENVWTRLDRVTERP